MKLKIGNWLIHQKALTKIGVACFLIGIPFGVKFAAQEHFKESSFLYFYFTYVLLLPKILKGIGEDIERIN